jgi:hypothetical protein
MRPVAKLHYYMSNLHCKDEKDASDKKVDCMADALNCDDPSSHIVRHVCCMYVLLVFFVLILLAGGVGALYVKKLGPFAPKTGSDSNYVATEASTAAWALWKHFRV